MDWGDNETITVTVFGAGLLMFTFGYIFLVWGVYNELVIIRRYVCSPPLASLCVTRVRGCQMCRLRLSIMYLGWLLIVLYLGLLYFDLLEKPRVQWPSLAFARPIVCVVLGMFLFFTTTHPVFRWIVRRVGATMLHSCSFIVCSLCTCLYLSVPVCLCLCLCLCLCVTRQCLVMLAASIVCNTFTTAELKIVIDCRSANTCTNRSVFSLWWLEIQWIRNVFDMFVAVSSAEALATMPWHRSHCAVFPVPQTVTMLCICALSVSMGFCSSRYPPRLFDSSVPMSFVPTSSGGNPTLMMGMTAGMRDGTQAFERLQEANRLAAEAADARRAATRGNPNAAAGPAPSSAQPARAAGGSAEGDSGARVQHGERTQQAGRLKAE